MQVYRRHRDESRKRIRTMIKHTRGKNSKIRSNKKVEEVIGDRGTITR